MKNAAIVGLGWWGKVWVESVQGRSKRVRFVKGVTKEPDLVREFAATHDLPLVTEYQEVLDDKSIDIVVLATPHSLHLDQISRAASAGKQVFTEKPLSLTRADGEKAIAACARAGVNIAIGHNRRWWPPMMEIKRMIGAGELGTIMHVEGNFSHDILSDVGGSWRDKVEEAPAGGMTGMGIHLTDSFINMVGPISEVYAHCVSRHVKTVRGDTTAVLIKFANGVTGFLSTIMKTPFLWRFHVFGSDAWAETCAENHLLVVKKNGERIERHFPQHDSVAYQMELFLDTLETGKPYPISTAQMIQNTAVLEAIIESTRVGRPVSLT